MKEIGSAGIILILSLCRLGNRSLVGFGDPGVPICEPQAIPPPQSIQLLPSIMSYINKRELELMKKFREQLEEQTRMLQADIRSQRDALEMMKEQLQRIQDSTFQVRGQFQVSKWQKGEVKRDFDSCQSVSHRGLLGGRAAAPGWQWGHLEWSSAGTFACAVFWL